MHSLWTYGHLQKRLLAKLENHNNTTLEQKSREPLNLATVQKQRFRPIKFALVGRPIK